MGGEGPTPYEVLLDAAIRGDASQFRPPGRGRGDLARRPAATRFAAARRGLRARHLGAGLGGRARRAITEAGGSRGCRDAQADPADARRDDGARRLCPPMTPLRERPAWAALERHYGEIRDLHLRDLFAEDPTRGERLAAEGAGIYLDYSKNRVTDETLRAAAAARRGVGARRAHGGDVPGRPDQHDREPLGPPRRAADAEEQLARRGRARRRRRRPRGARPHGRVLRSRSLGRVEGPHGQADPQRRERRDRRLRLSGRPWRTRRSATTPGAT